jgi:hypothetical protein
MDKQANSSSIDRPEPTMARAHAARRHGRLRVVCACICLLTICTHPAPAAADDKAQEEAARRMREQIEALPLSREEKDRLLERQMKVMATRSPQQDRWQKAREVRYKIVGEYAGRWPLDPTGDAQVRDRVVVEFVVGATDGRLKDKPAIRNEPSEVGDLQPQPKGCRRPELKGKFEFYTLEAIEPLSPGGPLVPYATVRFSRNYPDMIVASVCTGPRAVAARSEQQARQLMIPTQGQFLQQKTDTIVVQELGWTWTYEATPR